MTTKTLLLAFAFTGCQVEPAPDTAVVTAPEAPAAPAATPVSDTNVTPTAATPAPSGTDSAAVDWAGTYTFEEAVPNQTWAYTLTLRPASGGGYTGTFDADGFQTHSRYAVRGDVSGNGLAVVLTGYRPENMFEIPAVGTTLFTLVSGPGNRVTTRWGSLEPNLNDTPREGVAFVRS